MARHSVHIGVAESPGFGEGIPELLDDASRFFNFARDRGFSAVLLNTPATTTHSRVTSELKAKVAGLAQGDLLLVSFAGHGTSKDRSSDLDDDQFWMLSDQGLCDNDRFNIWAGCRVRAGILYVADCCFSDDGGGLPPDAMLMRGGFSCEERTQPDIDSIDAGVFMFAATQDITFRGVYTNIWIEEAAKAPATYDDLVQAVQSRQDKARALAFGRARQTLRKSAPLQELSIP